MVRVLTQLGTRIPMRDGIHLVADAYVPERRDPVPVLLMRTPYGRATALSSPRELYGGHRFLNEGYAVVVQDTRGRYDSEGSSYPFRHEAADGVDSIAWAARQRWSSGRVAMIGGSYPGACQWLAASENPPSLAAIAPIVTAANYRDGWVYRGGAFELGFSLDWTLLLCLDAARRRVADGRSSPALVDRVLDARDRIESLYLHLDRDAEELLRELAPYYMDWRAHPDLDAEWPSIAPDPRPEATIAPALNVGGWYDNFLVGTLANFHRQRVAALAARRPGPRLIVGPWTHDVYSGIFRGRRFGSRSAIDTYDIAAEQVRWFDRWVRELPNGVENMPPVRLFVMGRDAWQDFSDWPPPNVKSVDFHLGIAKTGLGGEDDGILTLAAGDPGRPPDRLFFDPASPVPTIGGGTQMPGTHIAERAGPVDMTQLEQRSDVLVYTSGPFEKPMTMVGPVELRIHAESSVGGIPCGFDIVAHLTIVAANGRSELLTGGILRVAPDSTHGELVVAMGATAATIGPGDRIRLDIAGSDFPRFDLNPSAVAIGGGVALLGGPAHRPARLVVPVFPETA